MTSMVLVTVTAVSGLVVQEVDGDRFVDAILSTPQVALTLLRQTAGRLRLHTAAFRLASFGTVATVGDQHI